MDKLKEYTTIASSLEDTVRNAQEKAHATLRRLLSYIFPHELSFPQRGGGFASVDRSDDGWSQEQIAGIRLEDGRLRLTWVLTCDEKLNEIPDWHCEADEYEPGVTYNWVSILKGAVKAKSSKTGE